MLFKTLVSALLLCMSVAVAADSERPTDVTGLSGSAISSNVVRIDWNAARDNAGVAGYNIYRNNYYIDTVTSTNYLDYEVGSNSSYRYAVVAFDRARNFTPLTPEITVSTNASNGAAPPPREAPSAPSNLWAEVVNANALRIHWDPPESGDTTGYNVYQDRTYVTTVRNPQYTTPWINSGQDYRFHVVAIDSSVNFSPGSQPLIARTGQSQDTSQAAPGLLDDYRLVFSEEFRGSGLDASKWNTRYRWGSNLIINNEKQYYVDTLNNPGLGVTPFQFDGEHLTISANPTPDRLLPNTNWQKFTSGAINTSGKFNMKYGYVEMRAKLPRGKGLWPAFWLLHQSDYQRRPEIDIMEMLGHQPDLVYQTYHYFNENWHPTATPSHNAWGPDYSQDFHTYAIKWEPGSLVWYIDGQETHRIQNGNVSWENMYIIVNLAVGGWWPGSPDGSTPFPAQMTIDYIRAYQK